METIQIYSNKVTIEHEDNEMLVTINNVSVDDIVPQFKAVELLQAIADTQDLSVIADWLSEQLKSE